LQQGHWRGFHIREKVGEERPLAPARGTIALTIVMETKMETKARADIDGGAIDPDPDPAKARVIVAAHHSDHMVT